MSCSRYDYDSQAWFSSPIDDVICISQGKVYFVHDAPYLVYDRDAIKPRRYYLPLDIFEEEIGLEYT